MPVMSPGQAPAPIGRPRSADADRAILDAAHDLLATEGYDGLTMAAVAHRAGVSTATLYRRFSSKEELVVAVLAHVKTRVDVADTGSLLGDLWSAADMGRATLMSPAGKLLRSMIGEVQRNEELRARINTMFVDGPCQELRAIVERAVARGEIPPVPDADVVIDHLIAPMHMHVLMQGDVQTEDEMAHHIAFVLAALHAGVPAGAPRPGGRRKRAAR